MDIYRMCSRLFLKIRLVCWNARRSRSLILSLAVCVGTAFFIFVFHNIQLLDPWRSSDYIYMGRSENTWTTHYYTKHRVTNQYKLIPTMAIKQYQPTKYIEPRTKAKTLNVSVKTLNENIHIHRQEKGSQPLEIVPPTTTINPDLLPPLDFTKIPGEKPVDTCGVRSLSGTHHVTKSRRDTLGKCMRIHYYNPPEWISPNFLEHCDDRCYLTAGEDYQTAPAVVFQTSTLTRSAPTKPPGQIWIFHTLESPVYSRTLYQKWKKLFNWTFTYRRDSDIMQTYASLHKREIELDLDNYMQSVQLSWSNKSRDAAWFVSRCPVHSSRDVYVKRLKNLVNVDVFGKCGNLTCPNTKWRDCNIMLNTIYRFYLSFENALCTDYVTEKVFNDFVDMSYVIPVIRGATNYSLYLPPGTYINTHDFKHISNLASYMKTFAAANETVIQNYFKWWRNLYFKRSPTNGFCELCRRLHHADEYKRVYDDVGLWMIGDEYKRTRMCQYAKDIH